MNVEPTEVSFVGFNLKFRAYLGLSPRKFSTVSRFGEFAGTYHVFSVLASRLLGLRAYGRRSRVCRLKQEVNLNNTYSTPLYNPLHNPLLRNLDYIAHIYIGFVLLRENIGSGCMRAIV